MGKHLHECEKCERSFATARGLQQHDRKAHPYIPPPPPKRETHTAPDEYENHTLIGGNTLSLGDIVWVGRKTVITSITKTEGSKDVSVVLRITRKWWSAEEIS
jgi:hypothetical protein